MTLKSEPFTYLALAEDLSDENDPSKMWESNELKLHHWAKVHLFLLSSASVEHVNSLLKHMYLIRELYRDSTDD